MPADRRDAALRDLEKLEEQRRSGLVDDATADRLWVRYAREAVAQDDPPTPTSRTGDETAMRAAAAAATAARGGRWGRRLGLLTLAAAGAGVIGLGVGSDVSDRGAGAFITGNEATARAAPATGGRDLSEVTNEEMEQVVTANPDVVPMRVRLAHRYLDDGQFDRAVEHYLQVLDREDHPEAMSHLGWILFTQGRAELAAPLLDRSRELDPQDPEAVWFQANLLLYGQDDPAPAVPLLEGLLRRDDLGDTQRSDVETALQDARSRLEDAP